MVHPALIEAEGEFSVPREQVLTVRPTTDGLPTGPFQMNGDYSVTPGLFYAEVPPGQTWYIATLGVYISAAGTIFANGYGPIPALTNGVTFQIEDPPGVPVIPPFPATVKTNGQYQSLNFRRSILDTGPGINHVTFDLDFRATVASSLILTAGQRLAVRPADDLTALTEHFFALGGYWLSAP